MSEPHKTPPPRKTAAVTIAGVLLLLPAAASALMAFVFAPGSHLSNAYASGVGLVAAAIFGYAGLASIRRWRGWRIWAGAAAWCLIAFVVLSLFATPPPPPPGADRSIDRVMFSLIVAVAVFVLVAKRRERKPDLAAVFED